MSSQPVLKGLIPLFCKPPLYAEQLLYKAHEQRATIAFRSLQLDTDMDLLYDWVNSPYSKHFWQLNGSKSLLYNTYQSLLDNPHAHSFIGLFNEQPVCQVDVYNVADDELSHHTDYNPHDCGMHFLMMPPKERSRGLSLTMLRHFIRFYFSFPRAEKLFAEPDRENATAGLLAVKAGFVFVKEIQLSYKTAHLYCITKEQFYATHSNA